MSILILKHFSTFVESNASQEYYNTVYNNRTWDKISNKMKNLQKYIFDKVLLEVIEFCQQSKKTNDSTIVPTCALVTGVNLPDHTALFKVCTFYFLIFLVIF